MKRIEIYCHECSVEQESVHWLIENRLHNFWVLNDNGSVENYAKPYYSYKVIVE